MWQKIMWQHYLKKRKLTEMKDEIKKNVRQLLDGCVDKMHLVTREEFDVQVKVLERTRQKVDVLEEKLDILLAQIEQK